MNTEIRLKEIIISVTNRCTLRCEMCQIPLAGQGGEMSTRQLEKLILDSLVLCPHSIVFSGGEPLLRKDIFDMIALVTRHKVNTCLTSNGTILTDDAARRLAAAGMGVVNISIDGDEQTHDALRGKGNFLKAVEALNNLSRHGIEATIASIVCRQNYASLPFVMDLARQHGVTTVKFQPFSTIFLKDKEVGRKFFAPPELLQDIQRSMAEVVRLANQYKIATNPESYLNSVASYLCGGMSGNAIQNGCAALWMSCPVTAEGNVFPCWVLLDKPVGNVKNRKLSEMWGSEGHDRLRREIVLKGCKGCMMSCYDNNFGKQELHHLITLKAKKLGDADVYKRMYFRLFQNARYVARKIVGRLRFMLLQRSVRAKVERAPLLEEINDAREKLQQKLKNIEP